MPAGAGRRRRWPAGDKPAIGLTMFGVTHLRHPAVERLRDRLDSLFSTPPAPAAGWRSCWPAACCRALPRRRDDRGRGSAPWRRAAAGPGPPGRGGPVRRALGRPGRRAGHGELLGAGDGARAVPHPVCSTATIRSTLMRTTAEENAANRRLDRQQAQRLPGRFSFSFRRRRPALDIGGRRRSGEPGGRRGALCHAAADDPCGRGSGPASAGTPTTRPLPRPPTQAYSRPGLMER